MKKTFAIFAVIVALAAAALLAVHDWPERQSSQKASAVPDDTQIAQFETTAVSACRCAKGKEEAGIKGCWAQFDKDIEPFKPTPVYSMCRDSNESLCFGMPGGFVTPEAAKKIKCISVNRSGSGVCTEADARAAAAKAGGADC